MLDKEEKILMKKIESTYYMPVILKRLNDKLSKVGVDKVLDYSHQILKESQADVEELLDKRVSLGKIHDKAQARKSIVGAAFSNLVIYAFLLGKEKGLVRDNIFITNKVRSFEGLVSINVDGETQKPDMDLIIYSISDDKKVKKFIIISLKTSLRERAGQTYKWKLLLEIATTENAIKDKYNIKYDVKEMPLVCFATVNFYSEINQPQHRGMFKFFDNSFIGKPLNSSFISNLSYLLEYSNSRL